MFVSLSTWWLLLGPGWASLKKINVRGSGSLQRAESQGPETGLRGLIATDCCEQRANRVSRVFKVKWTEDSDNIQWARGWPVCLVAWQVGSVNLSWVWKTVKPSQTTIHFFRMFSLLLIIVLLCQPVSTVLDYLIDGALGPLSQTLSLSI